MKRKEAEDKSTIFFDYKKIFDNIDKDKNHELSKYEITGALENDIQGYKNALKWSAGMGIVNALAGIMTNKTSTPKLKISILFSTAFCLILSVHSKLKVDTLNRRVAQGFN